MLFLIAYRNMKLKRFLLKMVMKFMPVLILDSTGLFEWDCVITVNNYQIYVTNFTSGRCIDHYHTFNLHTCINRWTSAYFFD